MVIARKKSESSLVGWMPAICIEFDSSHTAVEVEVDESLILA